MITEPVKGIPVILLPLRPASLTRKNPQGRKIIHGTHPAGCKEWSFDRSIYAWLKPEIKPTSVQIKRTIWPVYIIGQEVISERINRSISMQISFISKLPFWFTLWSGYSLCLPYMGSTWVTMVILRADLAMKDKKSFKPLLGQVSKGSRFIQTMTNPRVFLRVKVLLAVLQLPTIAKRKKEILSAVVENLWWLKYDDQDKNFICCDVCTKFNRKNSLHQNEKCRNYQHLIKWPLDSTADTWTSET